MSPFRLSVRALPSRSASPALPPRSAPHVRPVGVAAIEARPVEPTPVAVPWRVTGRSLGIIEIEHRGTEPAHQVRFALSGAGMLGLSLPSTLRPGERVRVAVRGVHTDGAATAHDAMLVMRWFQPDGTELLWPIALE